ncbi:Sulfate transporter/antisigma-factor antagonist STAS [Thalassoporum mexicanum PCC 7367]|uniref:STAS domain-containing protein n=1 Tax=Thalassoporum mexicanum TaxID=3457544 RepID=UPI00029F9D59|nr:STAS domain-containing protein [Pseudanabaena sp. PCC 7367]AFY68883.1 Sulfate transporter/antisigma-factor antagonist STAS [Pseudanabaena sp. PCC 7367]
MKTKTQSAKKSFKSISNGGQAVVIRLSDSSFDNQSATELFSQIESYTAANSLAGDDVSPNLLLDFQDVESLDSAGLSVLITALHNANKAGSSLSLCCVNNSVRLVLELTKIDQRFAVFGSQDEFIAYVNSTRQGRSVVAVA